MHQNAAEFQSSVDDVFARIAGRYDMLCDIFSFGIHRLWKGRMAKAMAAEEGSSILDVASGTGDIAKRYLTHIKDNRPVQILVTDICPDMLEVAKNKLGPSSNRHDFRLLDVYDMDTIADASIDICSFSFAMKICERDRVMEEVFRVLRPGGVFYCLEASEIFIPIIQRVYLKYMSWCMPVIGRLAANGDGSAYAYLLRGIKDFPAPEKLSEEFVERGFHQVSYQRLSLGITALHRAIKP